MRLASLHLLGYRRFAPARMSLDSPVVAIVGPNQAGKSSFLAALVCLGDGQPISTSDLNRSTPPEPGEPVVEARFRVDSKGRAALGAKGIDAPQFFLKRKAASGEVKFATEPELHRGLASRKKAVARLRNAAESAWVRALPDVPLEPEDSAVEGPTEVPATKWLAELADALDSDRETLPGDVLERVETALSLLKGGGGSSHRSRLRSALHSMATAEKATHPADVANSVLTRRIPDILAFDDEARTLLPEYDFGAIDPELLPSALDNLLALADVDPGTLKAALASSSPEDAVNLLDPANARLKAVFDRYWQRANFSVRLERQGTRLHVLTEREPGKWASIAESSDGMRAFVALIAFANQFPTDPPPILLVDEAEAHLHYEAQADLVTVFESQEAAGQIVYTTHSAGCLPTDMGRGVRVIEQVPNSDRSEIRSSFWTMGPGFTPLIIAMGASALAFTPTRFAVIAEGGTETLLLPSLVREAVGVRRLPFQVAPGLANADEEAIAALGFEASKVAYLVDSDEGGRKHRERLRNVGVPSAAIVFLGRGARTGLAIEDLVDPRLLSEAVALESAGRHGPGHGFSARQLPNKGRATWIDKWFAGRGLEPLSKPEVASRVLDLAGSQPVSDRNRRWVLRLVYDRLRTALKIED